MAFKRNILAAGALAGALTSAAFAAGLHAGDAAGACQEILKRLGGGARIDLVSSSSAAAAGGAAPTDAHLAQEGKAAGLFTGRDFLAGGGAEARLFDIRIAGAATPAPDGWRDAGKKIVHRESGLECAKSVVFKAQSADGRNRAMTLTSVSQYDQRGRDVSCAYSIDGEASIMLYASFYPDMKIEDHASGAVAAISQNFNVKRTLSVTVVEITHKNEDGTSSRYPAPLAAGFDIGEINGVPYKTAVWLAETHGWHVKTRATYARGDIQTEIAAAILFGANYVNIDMKNRADPTAAGAEA